MKSFACILLVLAGALFTSGTATAQVSAEQVYDVVIVGGTPGGIMAAISTARMGKTALLLERTEHIGGLPANGLGATDIATRGATGGLFQEFVQRVRSHYVARYGENSRQVADCSNGYHFEPSVAEQVFEEMLQEHPGITVERMMQFDALPTNVVIRDSVIEEITLLERRTKQPVRRKGRVFIDATYEGDLDAAAGVPYVVGRESISQYQEPGAGVIYKLWGGTVQEPFSTGMADNSIQAYNYRLALTNDPNLRVPIRRPESYNRAEYASLVIDVAQQKHTGSPPHSTPWGMQRIVNKVSVPNQKTDANNQHLAFISTDLPEENWPWPTSTWEWRDRFAMRLRDYTLGLIWFAQNDPALPDSFRQACRQWGLARDEYIDNQNFPRQVYVREGRRIKGLYFFTARDATPESTGTRPPLHAGSITASHYAIDSHAVRKREDGRVHLDGFLSYPTEPYTVPYGVIVPPNVKNLLSPVPVSGSHIGFSTLRMEPCWMALGQAAGVAAVLSVNKAVAVQKVAIPELQDVLLDQRATLIYYRDVPPTHPVFKAVQYFGLRGLLPDWYANLYGDISRSQAVEWMNKTGVTVNKPARKRGELLMQMYEAAVVKN